MTDTDHDKIIRVEEKVGALSSVVYEIKDNHLVHIASDIKGVNCKVEDLDSKIDALNIKIALYAGGASVLLFIAEKIWK